MSQQPILPQVGDRVLFVPLKSDPLRFPESPTPKLAAIVVYVIGYHSVNLAVFDVNGQLSPRNDVILRQHDDDPPGVSYCEWPTPAMEANN